jgi:hypothetical protein
VLGSSCFNCYEGTQVNVMAVLMRRKPSACSMSSGQQAHGVGYGSLLRDSNNWARLQLQAAGCRLQAKTTRTKRFHHTST